MQVGEAPANPKKPDGPKRLDIIRAAKRQAERLGVDFRDPTLEAVEQVQPWMAFVFGAIAELNTCATINGVIPWTAIRAYAETYGLDVDELDDLVRIVRAVEEGRREGEEDLKAMTPKDDKATKT